MGTITRFTGGVLRNLDGDGAPSPWAGLYTRITNDGNRLGAILNELIGIYRRAVKATVTCPDVSGGSTDAALTVAVTDLAGRAVDEAKTLFVLVKDDQHDPVPGLSSTVTFSAATVGSIVSSGAGWALVKTNASGSFACTCANSADETVYLEAAPVGMGAAAALDDDEACVLVLSNSDDATWSA